MSVWEYLLFAIQLPQKELRDQCALYCVEPKVLSAFSNCDWPMTGDNRKLDTLVNPTAFENVTREESWK